MNDEERSTMYETGAKASYNIRAKAEGFGWDDNTFLHKYYRIDCQQTFRLVCSDNWFHCIDGSAAVKGSMVSKC